ncbi:MAG TPA: YetF domain-containing protein [Bacteroidota bacterium]|nr:YetF domain-containing protein [Bacteroidota bacterium]
MMQISSSLLEIACRTFIIYIVVLIGIRLTGKREVGQMTPFDLVLLLLIANAVQNAMTGPDTSVTGGLVSVLTLLVANTIISRFVAHSKKMRKVIEGSPTILIKSGVLIQKNLEKERIVVDELQQALREHGIALMEDVGLAVLEVDGSISVLKNDELPTVSQPHHHIRYRRKP